MRSIVFEDNSNSLRYWIYTLIIGTYRVNKRGFDCALCLLAGSLLSLAPFFSLFFLLHVTRAPCATFFTFFSCTPSGLEPLTFRIPLAYQPLFYTTIPRGSVENYPSKNHFYFTWLVRNPQNLHCNLLIHVFNACCMLHENMHRICGSLINKRGGYDLFRSPNRFDSSYYFKQF